MKSLATVITESVDKFTLDEGRIISKACHYVIKQSEYDDNPDSYTFKKFIEKSDFGKNASEIGTIANVKELINQKRLQYVPKLKPKEIVLAFLLISYIRSTDDSTYGFDKFIERDPSEAKVCSMGNVSKLKTKLTEMVNDDEKLSDLLW